MERLKKSFNQFLNHALPVAALVLLIFIPIYPKFPALDIPGTYVKIRLDDFLVAVALALTFLKFLLNRQKAAKPGINRAIALYWLIGGVSLLGAIFSLQMVFPHLALLHYLRRIEYMGLFFLGFFAIREKKEFNIFLNGLFLATFFVFIYGLGQKFFGWPVVSTMNEEFSKGMLLRLDVWARLNSTFAGHYDLAAFLSLVLPLILASLIKSNSKRKQVLLGFLYLFSYYLLLNTASRVSFVAYLAAIFFLLLFLNKKWFILPVVGLSLIGMLFSEDITQRFAATIKIEAPRLATRLEKTIDSFLPEKLSKPALTPTPILPPTPTLTPLPATLTPAAKITPGASKLRPTPVPQKSEEEFWQEQRSVELGVERSGGIRFDYEWPRALTRFKKSPLLGTGFSSLGLATDNDYLRALGETGLLGLLSFLLIFLEGLKLILEKGRKSWQAKAMAASALAMLANACFIDVFEASKVAYVFWLLLGLTVGYLNHENSQNL
ncbi:O-antigen ligase family protein [Candidatus Shapirobacteria bacterium]|nr:O-antigen ligase family protein [Candidatus Shapirobacteria bacterium]